MSTSSRDREVFAVDVSDGIRSRTDHRPRGQVGNRAHCDLLCHASLPSAADGPWPVIVHLPAASCGNTPKKAWRHDHLPAPMIARCGGRHGLYSPRNSLISAVAPGFVHNISLWRQLRSYCHHGWKPTLRDHRYHRRLDRSRRRTCSHKSKTTHQSATAGSFEP